MSILVYGGCYEERCISPSHAELAGSGLRGAKCLLYLNQTGKSIEFLTTIYKDSRTILENSPCAGNTFSLHADCHDEEDLASPRFSYANAMIAPRLDNEISKKKFPEVVHAECALVYDTLESRPKISADTVVFDPQSPLNAAHFHDNGSAAKRCALVLNHHEAMSLGGSGNLFTAIDFLRNAILKRVHSPYEVIVVKMSYAGCWVCTKDDIFPVPAFKTDKVYSIGSGDIFSSAFFCSWALQGLDVASAAQAASRVTAEYCSELNLSTALETALMGPSRFNALPIVKPGDPILTKKIYLAAPFFTQGDIALVEMLRNSLSTPWTRVFSPMHDVGFGPAEEVYQPDIDALEDSDLIFAVLNHKDLGTIFEIGYAVKCGKPVHCLAEAVMHSDLTMVLGSGAIVNQDVTSAVYKALWATLN